MTGTVTKNAQEKICEKYKLTKIQFISGVLLIKWIDQYADYYWNDIPSKIGEYLSQLSVKYKEMDTRLSLLNVGDKSFYVEQDVYYNPHESEYKKQKIRRSLYHKVNIEEE